MPLELPKLDGEIETVTNGALLTYIIQLRNITQARFGVSEQLRNDALLALGRALGAANKRDLSTEEKGKLATGRLLRE